MERRFRYKEIQEMAERLRPFLAICRNANAMRGFLREEYIRDHARALALLLPNTLYLMKDWLRVLDELENDMSYRERALRAEKHLRDRKKRR
jgi:hypothetical protein